VKLWQWFQKLWRKPSSAGLLPTSENSFPLLPANCTPEPVTRTILSESKASSWRPDHRSQRNIDTLEPLTAKLATEHLRRLAAEGMNFKVTSGTRTMAEQAALYAQGRTAAGAVVTKARPGYSWHNFGVAYDLTLFSGKNPIWESPKYLRAGEVGKDLGLEWGGEWRTFKDTPHFQRPMGVTLAQARAKWPTGVVA
jgi:peptidoglycan L-alanyl-D-glutamate endopeptidase CwlK